LCAEPAPRWPTAIVCADDLAALQAMRAGELRGIAVPERVSVIGSGNQAFGALTSPPLTTVDIPWIAAGEAAADRLLAWHEQRPVQEPTLTAKLVIRRSCGPARGFT
jgi:LacI family transcriptional regulator